MGAKVGLVAMAENTIEGFAVPLLTPFTIEHEPPGWNRKRRRGMPSGASGTSTSSTQTATN